MYKILTIFILSTFIISCSENDSPDNSNPFPIIENISTQNVSIGEIISINGTGFYSNENYIASFNGVQGEIVEVNSNYLKVKIPQDATSGNITLSVNSQSKIIGTITINSTDIFKLYAFKGDDDSNSSIIPSIVQIDPTNGDENTIATLPEYISDLAFNSETNQIYGIAWVDHKLYTIDISNGNSTYVSLDNSVNSDSSADIFYELIIDAQNNLYAFKGDDNSNSSVIPSIVQIDPTNGNESTIATLPEYISDLAFNNETNQIYGIAWEDHKLYTIDISNGTSSFVNLDNSVNSDSSADIFYELIIDAQNNLYAFKGDDNSNSSVIPSIVQIDPTNGNESTIATLPEYISDLALNNETNQIYGIAWGGNKLYTIDISNGNSSFVNLDSSDNSENIFYELISN